MRSLFTNCTDDVLDELAASKRHRGESQFKSSREERSGSVYENADGRRNVTIQDLFMYEAQDQTARGHALINKAKERRLVIVFFIASALGIIGGFAGSYFFQQYWYYANGPTYEDVSPIADPSAIADAHLIRFDSTLGQYIPQGGVIETSTTKSFCVAPTSVGSGNQPAAVSFWAVADNCCSGDGSQPRGIKMDCSGTWSGATLGEVTDSTIYADAAQKSVAWWGTSVRSGALYVRVLSDSEHNSAQRTRFYTAWLCLLAATLGWPLTIGLLVFVEKCFGLCNLFDPDPSKRCQCCRALFCWRNRVPDVDDPNYDPAIHGNNNNAGGPSGVELRAMAIMKEKQKAEEAAKATMEQIDAGSSRV